MIHLFFCTTFDNLLKLLYLCESIGKQGMLHSRGELLLMLDADGATKVTDLEKLENQVISGCMPSIVNVSF